MDDTETGNISTPVTPIGFSAYNHWVNGKHLSAGINDASALAV